MYVYIYLYIIYIGHNVYYIYIYIRHMLYCVRLSPTSPFSENYTKLYFDAKHLERELNRAVGWRG